MERDVEAGRSLSSHAAHMYFNKVEVSEQLQQLSGFRLEVVQFSNGSLEQALEQTSIPRVSQLTKVGKDL